MFFAGQAFKLFRDFLQPVKCDEKSLVRENYLLKEELPMAVALIAAERSKDPHTQVGACIVDDENRILSYGYNGFPTVTTGGNNDNRFSWNKTGTHPYVCHAERNAIDYKSSSVRGATLFVTLYPCNECAKTIVMNKIKRVVYLDIKDSKNIKLAESMHILENGLAEKPIQFREYLKQKVGDEKAKRGFEIPKLKTMFYDLEKFSLK